MPSAKGTTGFSLDVESPDQPTNSIVFEIIFTCRFYGVFAMPCWRAYGEISMINLKFRSSRIQSFLPVTTGVAIVLLLAACSDSNGNSVSINDNNDVVNPFQELVD